MSIDHDDQNTQITLQVQQYCGERPSDSFLSRYDSLPIVIGRSDSCDFILMDVSKYISSKHALIYSEKGQLYVHDTSANGVYINRSIYPIGRGNTEPLSHGDTLSMGDFRLLVEVGITDEADNQSAEKTDKESEEKTEQIRALPTPADNNTSLPTMHLRPAEMPILSTSDEDMDSAKTQIVRPPTLAPRSPTHGGTEPIPIDGSSASKTDAARGTMDPQSAVDLLLEAAGINRDQLQDCNDENLLRSAGALLTEVTQKLMSLNALTDGSPNNLVEPMATAEGTSHDKMNNDGPFGDDSVMDVGLSMLLGLRSTEKIVASDVRESSTHRLARATLENLQAQKLEVKNKANAALESALAQLRPDKLEKIMQESDSAATDAELWQLFVKNYNNYSEQARSKLLTDLDKPHSGLTAHQDYHNEN